MSQKHIQVERPVASPLEIAMSINRAYAAGLGVNGREKGQDRRGGVKLAKDLEDRAEAVKDTVEISPAALGTKLFEGFCAGMDETVATLAAYPPEIRASRTKIALLDAYQAGRMHASELAVAIDRKIRRDSAARSATVDVGDGLGLPLVSVGPSGIGGYAQDETDADRHNDDDAQRAAQERADAADREPGTPYPDYDPDDEITTQPLP